MALVSRNVFLGPKILFQGRVPPPQKPGPVGTFWIPWTFRYVLDEDGDEEENEDENVKLDFFQCETGMVSM